MEKRIAIFASSNGTNAENIIRYFQKSSLAKVVVVLSNKKDAKVLERARNLDVDTHCFSREDLFENGRVIEILSLYQPDLIVLAGFLLKFPKDILGVFPNKVINIHPALLPKYGGKGMYGDRVHQAVLDNSEKETGISIHYVNEQYDEGAIIAQKSVPLDGNDNPQSIARKVHQLEYEWFPKVIEEVLKNPDNLLPHS